MRHLRVFVILCGSVGLLAPLLKGQTVVAIASQDKELNRTAHQLRISAEHLYNARVALKEATDLARHSMDSVLFSQLAQHWEKIDKSRAQGAIEDLYGWLRTGAAGASDITTYQRCTLSAQVLIRSIAASDYDRAGVLWHQWPDPPSSLGEAFGKVQNQANSQFMNQLVILGAGNDPTDLTLLKDAAAKGNYASAGMLAARLTQSGDRAEALKVVDQAIADFQQRPHDARSIPVFLGFVRRLSPIDPERYLQAMNMLLPAVAAQGSPQGGGTVALGDQSIQVSAVEAVAIELCRSLNGWPDLAMKTLNAVPGLKGKLDRIGGIDTIAAGPASGTLSLNYSVDGISRTTYNRPASGSPGSGPATPGVTNTPARLDLYQSLRGKLAKNPEFVRTKIAEASRTPDQIDNLIALAGAASAQEPDLASLALDAASKLIVAVEPVQKRAGVMQRLIVAYQHCDGEVEPGVLTKGLAIVQQLRDEEKNNATTAPLAGRGAAAGRGSTADQLEMTIVSQLALGDYAGAMRFVRLMSDEMRIQALLQIVLSLTQNY